MRKHKTLQVVVDKETYVSLKADADNQGISASALGRQLIMKSRKLSSSAIATRAQELVGEGKFKSFDEAYRAMLYLNGDTQ